MTPLLLVGGASRYEWEEPIGPLGETYMGFESSVKLSVTILQIDPSTFENQSLTPG